MITSAMKFLWIAFRQYWGVWVTGTGLVGLLLWGLSFAQTMTGWKIRAKHYAVVLFCVFWFLATFSAWHDADKNLSNVINQRSHDVSDLGTCRGDLKLQTGLFELLKSQVVQQQSTINTAQSSLNKQQGTVNTCVVSLGRMNPRVTRETRVIAIPVAIMDPESKRTVGIFALRKAYLSVLVLTTNQVEERSQGDLNCTNPFKIESAPELPMRADSAMIAPSFPEKINEHEYIVRVSNTGSEWGPTTPMYLRVSGVDETVGRCTIDPR
jgi:hypothetical protein